MSRPPDAEELRAWLSFFSILRDLLSPLLLAALTALTVFFGKRSAEKPEIEELKKLGEKTHKLVNGQHGQALQTILDQAIRLANLTGHKDDLAAVEVARANVLANQRQLDKS